MGGVSIRVATVADAEAVARYHDRCFHHTFASELGDGSIAAPDPDDTRVQLELRFRPGSGFTTYVADVDGMPVGHVTVSGNHVVHLFVDPDHQRTGLGKRLLTLGETTIGAGGHTDLELQTRVENVAAVAFYEHAGWTLTSEVIRTTEHGLAYDERVLVKRVI